MSPLHFAANTGQFECLDALINARCDLDLQSETYPGTTALHEAVRFNHLSCVERLIAAKCNLDARDKAYSRSTPLHLAAELQNRECAAILRAAGAGLGLVTTDGRTAAAIAWEFERIDIAVELCGWSRASHYSLSSSLRSITVALLLSMSAAEADVPYLTGDIVDAILSAMHAPSMCGETTADDHMSVEAFVELDEARAMHYANQVATYGALVSKFDGASHQRRWLFHSELGEAPAELVVGRRLIDINPEASKDWRVDDTQRRPLHRQIVRQWSTAYIPHTESNKFKTSVGPHFMAER